MTTPSNVAWVPRERPLHTPARLPTLLPVAESGRSMGNLAGVQSSGHDLPGKLFQKSCRYLTGSFVV